MRDDDISGDGWRPPRLLGAVCSDGSTISARIIVTYLPRWPLIASRSYLTFASSP